MAEDFLKSRGRSRLTSKVLRRFSYGNVFYEHVRSGYTHEYHTSADSPQKFTCTPVAELSL